MNRRQRRNAYKQLGVLKNKSRRSHTDPVKKAISNQLRQEGLTKHAQLLEEMYRKESEKIEHALAEYKKKLEAEGWNAKEIELLSEAWQIRAVKDKETYQQDKKTIKSLTKEAEKLSEKRNK